MMDGFIFGAVLSLYFYTTVDTHKKDKQLKQIIELHEENARQTRNLQEQISTIIPTSPNVYPSTSGKLSVNSPPVSSSIGGSTQQTRMFSTFARNVARRVLI